MSEFTLKKVDNGEPVRFGLRRRQTRKLSKYEIVADGVVVGTVQERLVTFENRAPGQMYVNYRWQSPRWFAERLGETRRHGFHDTRVWAMYYFALDYRTQQAGLTNGD